MSVVMNDLEPRQNICRVMIYYDSKNGKTYLSQHNYIEKVLEINMFASKSIIGLKIDVAVTMLIKITI